MIDWVAVKEAMTDDAKGAIIGSLVGGGLGAGGGILLGKNKLVGGLVGGGAGAVSGGLAGYGLGRAHRLGKERDIAQLKGDLKDIYYKNMDSPSQRFHFGEDGGWKDDYSQEDWEHNLKGDLGIIEDTFALHPDNIKKIRERLKERLMMTYNHKLNGNNYDLERRISPEDFHAERIGRDKRIRYFRNKYE